MKKMDDLFTKLWDNVSIKQIRIFGLIFLIFSLVFLEMYKLENKFIYIIMFLVILCIACISFGISMLKKDLEEFSSIALEEQKRLNKILNGKRRAEVEFLPNLLDEKEYLIGKAIWENLLKYLKYELGQNPKIFVVYDVYELYYKLDIEHTVDEKEICRMYHNISLNEFVNNFKVVE